MSLAMLTPRLVVGLLFMGHGAQKLFGLFGGAEERGFEYNLVMIAAAFAVAGAGAGTWSLDGAFGLDVAGAGWGVGALLVGVLGGAAAVLTGRLHGAHQAGHHRHATPHSA